MLGDTALLVAMELQEVDTATEVIQQRLVAMVNSFFYFTIYYRHHNHSI